MKTYQSPIVRILRVSQGDVRTDFVRASNETEPDPLFYTTSDPLFTE